jgi:hypothetical protein
MLGSKKLGKTGFVAEMPLSRTISAVVMLTIPSDPRVYRLLKEVESLSRQDVLELSMERLGFDKVWGKRSTESARHSTSGVQ